MDGIKFLQERVKLVSSAPGVYRMLNARGDVLYVGKAKNLKNRLTNYTQENGLSNRIRKMVFETRELIVVETTSEQEALLLEISLIKSLKPKYNVIFRDDASYPYIHITHHEEAPRLTHHRGKRKGKGQFFGPYPDAKAMYQTMEEMEKVFQLRTCKDTDYATRTRPCLKHQIKRCSAPCVGKISAVAYKASVHDAVSFLKGKGDAVQARLQNLMQQAAVEMEYEAAADYRDRLQALSKILSKQMAMGTDVKTADFVAFSRSGSKGCLQIFSYLDGRQVGHINLFPKVDETDDEAEILRILLLAYYLESPRVPPEIYVAHDVAEKDAVASALAVRYEELYGKSRKITLSQPQKGSKLDILKRVQVNANEALKRKQAQGASWKKQLEHFAKILGVDRAVTRIETFDISNIQGRHPVASMVVAGEEGMLKRDYRKFSIKGEDRPDDYRMMRETLTRRYTRLLKETLKAEKDETAEAPAWPTVIMVDGGKGHLRVLTEVMEALDVLTHLGEENAPILCAIAKGEYRDKGLETIFQQGREFPLDIEFNSPLKFMLQVIRDESHRFAIGYHRQKRSKETIKSVLDDIPNVGPKRKRALLLEFGSAAGVKDASVDDLKRVDGISEELAQFIYDYLH